MWREVSCWAEDHDRLPSRETAPQESSIGLHHQMVLSLLHRRRTMLQLLQQVSCASSTFHRELSQEPKSKGNLRTPCRKTLPRRYDGGREKVFTNSRKIQAAANINYVCDAGTVSQVDFIVQKTVGSFSHHECATVRKP